MFLFLYNKKYVDKGIVYLNDLLFSLDNTHSIKYLKRHHAVSDPTGSEISHF